jgi:hypothetical protein
MPLIQNTGYNEFLELAAGATVKPNAGDRHAGTLPHWSLAIDAKAVMTRRVAGFLPSTAARSRQRRVRSCRRRWSW